MSMNLTMRVSSIEIAQGMAEVLAYGTVVVAEPLTEQK
jgi:uncharacterized protein YbjQ (UPF0145 family)